MRHRARRGTRRAPGAPLRHLLVRNRRRVEAGYRRRQAGWLELRPERSIEPVAHLGGNRRSTQHQAPGEQANRQLRDVADTINPRLLNQLVEQTAGIRRLGLDLADDVGDSLLHVAQERGSPPLRPLIDRDHDRCRDPDRPLA